MFLYDNLQLLKNVKKGDIVQIKYPSGNYGGYRVHNFCNNTLIGCSMGWDNGIGETVNITDGKVTKVTIDKKGRDRFKEV